MLASDWYKRRLATKRDRDLDRLKTFQQRLIQVQESGELAADLELEDRLAYVRDAIANVESPSYLDSLVGTLGADPLTPPLSDPSMIHKLA